MSYIAKMSKSGNIKLGASIWSFNKLAGSGVIAGCKGTCGEYCTGCYNAEDPKKSPCYVFKKYIQYGFDISTNAVIKGHIRNTIAIRDNIEQAFNDIQLQIKKAKNKPSAVRIHSSGEIEFVQELMKWIDTAAMFPDIPFYIYTKAYDILDTTLRYVGSRTVPNNFFINISIWHNKGIDIYNKWKHLDCIRAFVYDDGFDYGDKLKIDCYCPAYGNNGKLNHDFTCDKCKICFQSKAKVCGCYSH